MTEVRIPKLDVSVEEGEIVEWLVEDGATVQEGAPLYTLGTDKVDTEVESPATGVVKLIGEVGKSYSVGDVVAEIS